MALATAEGDLCNYGRVSGSLAEPLLKSSLLKPTSDLCGASLRAFRKVQDSLPSRGRFPYVDGYSRIKLAKRPTATPNDGCAYGNRIETAV